MSEKETVNNTINGVLNEAVVADTVMVNDSNSQTAISSCPNK